MKGDNLHISFHSLFDENLQEVDKGIAKIVALFNGLFTDGKTAFIFTSDHGMSNKGINDTQKCVELHILVEICQIKLMMTIYRKSWSWNST